MLSPWLAISNPELSNLEDMSREMQKLFGLYAPQGNIRGVIKGTFPPVNVAETPEKVIAYIYAPGIDPEKLDLTIEKNLLTISADRDTESEIGEKLEPSGYYRRERFTGGFKRVISLPESVDPSKTEASYEAGILTVSIAKAEEHRSRKIMVNAG